jgi:hypothetical protein
MARDGAAIQFAQIERAQEINHRAVRELIQSQPALGCIERELREVPAVGVQRIGRKTFFDSQVI